MAPCVSVERTTRSQRPCAVAAGWEGGVDVGSVSLGGDGGRSNATEEYSADRTRRRSTTQTGRDGGKPGDDEHGRSGAGGRRGRCTGGRRGDGSADARPGLGGHAARPRG